MALNGSGPISLAGATAGQSIAVELGLGTTTQISLNDSAVRTLAGVSSGAIIMPTDFYGKANAYTITYLVIAGGAGGAGNAGGAGGAGGYLTSTASLSKNAVYTVTVGGGGTGQAASQASGGGGYGSNSVLSGTGVSVTSTGGGRGGNGDDANGSVGGDGGSGGGGAGSTFTATAGSTNTGGGGGGGWAYDGGVGGAGGSGVVILKYLTADAAPYTITGGTATTSGLYTVRTFTATGNLVIS